MAARRSGSAAVGGASRAAGKPTGGPALDAGRPAGGDGGRPAGLGAARLRPTGPAAPDDPVVVARLGGPHGVAGELRLLPETDFPERLRPGRRVLVLPRDGGPGREATIERVRPAGRAWLVALQGIDSRERAAACAGGLLCVRVRDLPPLPAGQYYHHQLVGLTVLAADGTTVGRLARVDPGPANDVFVVARPDGREVLVPAARVAVAAIDMAAAVVRLRQLPGLLDD